MSRNLLAAQAGFYSLFIEALLHGVYTVLFVVVMYLFLFRRSRTTANMCMMGVFGSMYLVSTAHLALAFKESSQAFFQQHAADGDFSDFENMSDPFVSSQGYLEMVSVVATDCIVVWRAWAIYRHSRWFAAGSVCLICVLTVSAAGAAHAMQSSASGSTFTNHSDVFLWAAACSISTVVTNLWTTSFLGYKAWCHYRRAKLYFRCTTYGTPYKKILLLLVESGAIYALIWISCLAVAATTTIGENLLPDIIPDVSGIYSILVIVLVHLKFTQRDEILQFEASIALNTRRNESSLTSSHMTMQQQGALDTAHKEKELTSATAPQITATINCARLEGEWRVPAFEYGGHEQHV